jgi:hypothetical protein
VVLVGAAALLLVVALVATVLTLGSSDDGQDEGREDAAPDSEVADRTTVQEGRISCEPIGALDSAASQTPNAAQLTQAFTDLYATLEDVGCPDDPAFDWKELVVQELVEEEEPDLPGAMLVVRSSGAATYLTPTAYAQYRRLGSADGSDAQNLAGLPSPVQTFADGHQEVQLSKGALMVAEQEGAPFFWLHPDFVQLWRESTDVLGLPTGNPRINLEQDFQKGWAHIVDRSPLPELVPVADPGAELAALGELANTGLRQADGTAWWIGEDGRRYWIATGGVYDCLIPGGDESVGAVRGYAVSTLPYGGHAECSP